MSMVQCQLWMGGLEPYMTETFILASFERMGEKPQSVKVMRNKFTGEPAGYCFVHFENDDEAIDAMHKLNGKVIPNTNPPIRFRLNTATNQGKMLLGEKEFSLWVGDLPPEVDDYTLYKTFAARYQSIRAAKVILDTSGFSKGFGFLRFGSEDEQKHCLQHMNGFKGLGSKSIKISNAIPKFQRTGQATLPTTQSSTSGYSTSSVSSTSGTGTTQDYSHYYDPSTYWQNYASWGGYYDSSGGYSATQYSYVMPSTTTTSTPSSHDYQTTYHQLVPASSHHSASSSTPAVTSTAHHTDPDLQLVDHPKPPDVDKDNEEKAENIFSFWDALQNSKWTSPDLFESDITKMRVMLVE